MQNKESLVALAIIFLVVAAFLFSKTQNNHEPIRTQQYYQASLQYLEDMRNSNDIIFKQNEAMLNF